MGIGQNIKRQTDFVRIDFLHIKIHMIRSKVAQDHPLSGSRACGQGGRVATRAGHASTGCGGDLSQSGSTAAAASAASFAKAWGTFRHSSNSRFHGCGSKSHFPIHLRVASLLPGNPGRSATKDLIGLIELIEYRIEVSHERVIAAE